MNENPSRVPLPPTASRRDLLGLMMEGLRLNLVLVVQAARAPMPWRFRLRRLALLLLAAPPFLLLQVVHWVAFWLDEVVVPGHRRTPLVRPLIIAGTPRAGTTHLHRVLADDTARFTTPTTAEVLFAPSIVQKKLLRGLVAVDRAVGRPLARLVRWVEARLPGDAQAMHASGLASPEEDYFFLTMVAACSGLVLVFPESGRLWDLARGGAALAPEERARLLRFHVLCLQKHVVAAGPGRTLLTKNASFTPWLADLAAALPDAAFVVCTRDPGRAIPSMLHLANEARRSFGGPPADAAFDRRMTGLMQGHLACAAAAATNLPPERCAVVSLAETRERLVDTVHRLYRRFDWAIDPAFAARLERHAAAARSYSSAHRYAAADYGLDEEVLREEAAAARWLWDASRTPSSQPPPAPTRGQPFLFTGPALP